MMEGSTLPYQRISAFSQGSGLTEKAIRRKIEDGIWVEGREFIRAPDGCIYVSVKGFAAWMEKGSMSERGQSASRSRTTASRSAARSL
jgi:hypothetical protein